MPADGIEIGCTMKHRSTIIRRGSIYLLTCSTCVVASVLAVGGLLATRAQLKASALSDDAIQAQLAARSGLELARQWINSDSSWRTTRTNGTWAANLRIGAASVSIDVVDPTDGDLSNREYDSVVITSTAEYGRAKQGMSVTLVASPTPLPVLAYATHTNGEMLVNTGNRLILASATGSTNGALRNDGTIEGNFAASSLTTRGIVFGTVALGVASRATPGNKPIAALTSLGTEIGAGGALSGAVLGPGVNPHGAANADGIYVINSSSNLTIRNSRIVGTLVVNAPGKKVTLSGPLMIEPAGTGFPSLVVDGNLELAVDSSAPLSESALGKNFNPTGAPYNGLTDSDQADSYASEIHGLIHCTGTVSFESNTVVRGAIIAEANDSSSAMFVNTARATVNYDSLLFTSPPQFYTSEVKMIPQANSVKQVVK